MKMRCCVFPLSKGAETLYRGFYYRNGDFRIKTKMGGLSKEMKFLVNEINSIRTGDPMLQLVAHFLDVFIQLMDSRLLFRKV